VVGSPAAVRTASAAVGSRTVGEVGRRSKLVVEVEGLGYSSLGPTWLCVWCIGVWCGSRGLQCAVILGGICGKYLDIFVISRLSADVLLVLFPDEDPRAVPVKKGDNATAQVGRSQGLAFSLARNRFPRYPART